MLLVPVSMHKPTIGLLVVFLVLSGNAYALSWPDIPLPNGATTGWITKNSRFNGIPMRIQIFDIKWPPQRVMDYFVRRWHINPTHDLFGPLQRNKGIWLMRSGAGFYTSVQVEHIPGGSRGTVTIMPGPENWKQPKKTFVQLPAGLTVLTSQTSADGDSLVLTGKRSAAAETERLVDALKNEGWRITASRPVRSAPSSYICYLTRASARVQITAMPDNNRTLILLNRIIER